MNRMHAKIFFIIACLAAVSCSKEFLEQLPKDELTAEAYYRNLDQLDKGIIGCYTPLQASYNGANIPWTLGMISDEFSPWKNQSSMATSFTINGFTKNISVSQAAIWTTAYNNIQRCNRMIEVISDRRFAADASEEQLVNAYLGEARFIRALNYFNLVQLYGPVPLVTEAYSDPGDAVGIGRTGAASIFDQVIIPDFTYAAENCRLRSQLPSSQLGRVTSGAGYAMLGKAYLLQGNYPAAEAALAKVINSGEYDLLSSLAAVFDTKNENNKESIFEIQYDETLEDGSTYNRWIGYEAAPFVNVVASNESLWVSDSLISEYKVTGDLLRFNAWITDSVLNPASGLKVKDPFPKKLITTNTGLLNQNNNFIVNRYADVILMYAEALVMQSPARASEVIDEVNRIVTRAGFAPLSPEALTIDTIMHERRMELSFEGHRWYDLLRTGKAVDVMSAHLGKRIPDFQLVFPIPVEEIQKDPSLMQNPGY